MNDSFYTYSPSMIYTLTHHETPEHQIVTEALESGKVVYCPQQPFLLLDDEPTLLQPHLLDGSHKNISYHSASKQLGGAKNVPEPIQHQLKTLLHRYAEFSEHWVNLLFPQYKKAIIRGRTSYRPAEIQGRKSSKRKDDTRLHVDAFPSTPLQGKRILRVFSNIHPQGTPRVWHLGEPFQNVIQRFLPSLPPYRPWKATLAHKLRLTKTKRGYYDHAMLHLHDSMKLDEAYQQDVSKTLVEFPTGSLWFVYTDLVSHAALSGQFALEQTFYLPPEAMQDSHLSPIFQLTHGCSTCSH